MEEIDKILMDSSIAALAHLNSAEEGMLGLAQWKKWLLGEDYDCILKGIQMAQQYLTEKYPK